MKQIKLDTYWDLNKGDLLKGKKVIKILILEDEHHKTSTKTFVLEDGTAYLLDDEGLHKIEYFETKNSQ